MKKFLVIAALLLLATLLASGSTTFAQSPTATLTATTANANTQATATATLTATQTVTPSLTATLVAPSLTATKPAATATQTVAPSLTATKPAATATQTVAPSATATKPAATATVTKTATVAPTKTNTPVPPTATLTRAAAPRAGVVTSLSTMFAVQNTDPSTTANVTATFYDTTGAAVSTVNKTVNPFFSATIDQRVADGGLGSFTSWQGSVVLSSNTQLAAAVLLYGGNSSSGRNFRMDAYAGTSSSQAATEVLMPQVMKNVYSSFYQNSWNSTIAIQNTSASASASVTITYTNILMNPPATSVHSGITVPPAAVVFIDMTSEVPGWSSMFGFARLSSDQNVAVVVNNNIPGNLMTYVGYTNADASTSLIIPQALLNIGSPLWSSALEGMTTDGSSSSYTVTYKNILNGAQKTCNLPVGANFRIDFRPQFWPPSCTPPVDSNNRFHGQVVVVGTSPLVASINQIANNTANGFRGSTSPAMPSSGGKTTGFVPLVMNGYSDTGTNITWGTAIEGSMAGTGTVQINYYLSTGQTYTDTYTVGTDQIFRFDQRFANSQTGFVLPAGSIGSAKITAPFPIIFRVNISGNLAMMGDVIGTYKGITQ